MKDIKDMNDFKKSIDEANGAEASIKITKEANSEAFKLDISEIHICNLLKAVDTLVYGVLVTMTGGDVPEDIAIEMVLDLVCKTAAQFKTKTRRHEEVKKC